MESWYNQNVGSWQERVGRICLFRCEISTDLRRWFISFVPDGRRAGSLMDVDFYFADPDDDDDGDGGGGDENDASLPPRTGWDLEEEGLNPSPTVKKSENSDVR